MNRTSGTGNKLDRASDGTLKAIRFAEIPAEFLTQEVVNEWFLQRQHKDPESLADCYQEIPLKLRSRQLILWAAADGLNVLDGLDVNHPDYIGFAHACVRANYQHIASVDPAVRQEILPDFCFNNMGLIHRIDKLFPWFRDEISQETFENCCMNVDFALDSPIEKIPESQLIEMVVKNYSAYPAFRKRGLLHVIADRMKAGDWPEEVSDLAFAGIKPTSLEDGVNWITKCTPDQDHETLYMAYTMTYPMDQVVPVMSGRRLQRLLFEMYSMESLQPYLNKDRALRGILLEDSLGL